MSVQIFTLDKVREDELIETVKKASDDDANFVTAINDNHGTFTVESTFISDDAGAGGATISLDGKMSHFGGPDDHGVKPDEGLAIFDPSDVAANPDLFLPAQPPGTTGLARRLNPQAMYVACRWKYSVTPKSFLTMKTTKVKVSNPANNKTIDARPADWGPKVETGRVADLSPGLENALGLKTNDMCHVEIPTPAGAQSPPAGAGVATGINLAEIDATIFAPGMTRQLVVMTTSNNTTYWVINLIGENEGGQSLLRHADNKTDILLSDTTVFPVKESDQVPADVAAELNKAILKEAAVAGGAAGTPPGPGEDVSAKVFATAKAFVGQDTSHAPGTHDGKLACAWAVNEVVRIALGKPISTDENGRNGVGTDGIFAILKKHHTRLASAKPGAIIISPTPPNGRVHGHVGIVGQNAGGGVENTHIFSNSSGARQFAQNYTIKSWMVRYSDKLHLEVLFFELNRDQF